MADSGVPEQTPGEEEIRRRLRGFALRLTGDPHQAEDVAQETLARALVRAGGGDVATAQNY